MRPAQKASKHNASQNVEVFVYVRLNALVRVEVETPDLDAAQKAAMELCEEVGTEFDLASFERLTADQTEINGIEIVRAELVEITGGHDAAGPAPEFFGMKQGRRFIKLRDGASVETLPEDCR